MTESSQLSDGRPMVTDLFLVKLHENVDDCFDRDMAVKAWIEGDWKEALTYLVEEW